MKKKSIIRLLLTAAALAVLVSFAGCSLTATEADGTALDRSANPQRGGQPQEFSAEVTLMQFQKPQTVQLSSNRFRTTDEVLRGTIEDSGWDLLNGATVVMTNFTNFEGIFANKDTINTYVVILAETLEQIGFFNPSYLKDDFINNVTNELADRPFFFLSGTNHSKIKVYDEENGTLLMTMNANGKIEGNLATGANLNMTWNTTGPGPNARGNLDGIFSWILPSSQFTITGFYID